MKIEEKQYLADLLMDEEIQKVIMLKEDFCTRYIEVLTNLLNEVEEAKDNLNALGHDCTDCPKLELCIEIDPKIADGICIRKNKSEVK